jgi:protein-S-isoprenylcysteine O-methyltransferase Ste14
MNDLRFEKIMWVLLALYWLISSFYVKKTRERESVISRSGYILCVLTGFSLLFEDYFPWKILYLRCISHTAFWQILGIVLCAAGLLFSAAARIYLGRNWSGTVTLKKDHVLIQKGPYRITRNPIYTGFLVAFLGCVISLGEVKGVLGLVLLIVALLLKISKEEKMMIRAFGEQFFNYKSRVAKLVPWIY